HPGVRQVVAPNEHDIVGYGDLRVHVVVDGPRAVWRGDLARERRVGDQRSKHRDLPRCVGVIEPLPADLLHLRRVEHTREIDLPDRGYLGERPEDGAGGDYRRGDTNPALRATDGRCDPVGDRSTSAWGEPRPEGDSVHRDPIRVE